MSTPEALLNLWPQKAKRQNPLATRELNAKNPERRTLELLDSLATLLVSEAKSEVYAVGYSHEADIPPKIYIAGNKEAVPERAKTHALDIVERLSAISAAMAKRPRHISPPLTELSEFANMEELMFNLHLCVTTFTFPKYKHNVLKRNKQQWDARRDLCTNYLATQPPEKLARFQRLSTQVIRVRTAMLYDDEDGAVVLVPSLSDMMNEDGMVDLVKELDMQTRVGAFFLLAFLV